MSNDVLMAKTRLPADFVDLGIGEPHVLREEALRHYDLDQFSFRDLPQIWEYAPPFGYEPLVRELEEAHSARVVVTAGAKQGLAAAFHALKQSGRQTLGIRVPYWPSIPHVARLAGMDPVVTSGDDPSGCDAFLMVSPNNPDGDFMEYARAAGLCERLSASGVPVVHDAAYYTHAHLPRSAVLGPLGAMQVFSASKTYGLSGLRLGWVVCHDESYFDAVASYVEATTAGISTASQRVLLHIAQTEARRPAVRTRFESAVSRRLQEAKDMVSQALRPDVIRFARDPRDVPGMFAWGELGAGVDLAAARVNAMPGAAFGEPGRVRLNLGVPLPQLAEAVHRMNGLARVSGPGP